MDEYPVISIAGPIEAKDGDAFYAIARNTPNAHVLLESPGGLVEEGLWIGAEIALRGYSTWVLPGSGCHSICAVMWASGSRRYMSKDASVSVHAAYAMINRDDGSVDMPVSGSANAEIGAFLNEVGLSIKAIEYFTVARPEEPLRPITPVIAQLLDIDTYVLDGNTLIGPEDRPTPRRIAEQSAQYAGLRGNCTGVLDVSADFFEARVAKVLGRGHELFGEEVFAGLLREFVDFTKAEISANGFVAWCLTTERTLRAQGLDTGVRGPSFSCSKAKTSTEIAICASEDMWSLDRAMSWLYFFYRRNTNSTVSKQFLDEQRDWLRRRDRCSDDLRCLVIMYQNRLAEFGV
jgi:hypothetical protein